MSGQNHEKTIGLLKKKEYVFRLYFITGIDAGKKMSSSFKNPTSMKIVCWCFVFFDDGAHINKIKKINIKTN